MAPVMSHSDSRRRAQAALELRARARTWQSIADQLGYRHRNAARSAVHRLLKIDRPSAEESRADSAEQLRVLRSALFDHLAVAERDGDTETVTKVAREIRANLDSLATLDGLNAIQRREVMVTVTRSPADLIDAVRAELAQLPAPRRQRRQLDTIDAEIVTEENAV